ncbi:MAG: hypothetical protein NVS1B13_09540 [Flavisolibacter sp.]
MKYLPVLAICSFLFACNQGDHAAPAPKVSLTAENAKKDSLNAVALKDSANFTTIKWLDSTEQHLEKVKEGQTVEISWQFINTGTKPLVIARVQPGCGCTVAEQPEQPIAPGQKGIIKAKFNSNGHPNIQNKEVYIYANNSNKNNVNTNSDLLKFHIEVIPK